MKKLLLAACVSALIASPAMANKMDMDPSDKAEFMQKTLQLNDKQTQEVERIMQEAHQQKMSLKEKYKFSEYEQYKEEKENLRSKTHDRIREVLTEPQQEALDAHRNMMKKQRDGRMKGKN